MSASALAGETQPLLRHSTTLSDARRGSGRSSAHRPSNNTLPHGLSKKTSWWDSVFAIVTTAVGVGIVTLPATFKETGCGVAILLVLFCTLATVEAGRRLSDAMGFINDDSERINPDGEDMGSV